MLNCILYRVMISRFQQIFILSSRTVSVINRVHIGYQTTVLINMIYSIVKVLQNKQLSEEDIKIDLSRCYLHTLIPIAEHEAFHFQYKIF